MARLSKTERIGSVEKCKKHLQQISTSRETLFQIKSFFLGLAKYDIKEISGALAIYLKSKIFTTA